jgi:hypothetical protein
MYNADFSIGVRDLISHNTSHQAGSIRRMNSEQYGQHLVLSVSGTRDAYANPENHYLGSICYRMMHIMTDSRQRTEISYDEFPMQHYLVRS